ncbi:hypothetical protein BDA99DRAFT_561429 [Phascolomyces articulosus]|uniref:Uncharacterized protein n=1 Tax=Phascolomyces articulosus TaxID=60185 RepID=A0AAD5PBY8_9FUNG|nr:hypothetical protein BDA99DRAFT_561429 [Phascolomyces articulosus]
MNSQQKEQQHPIRSFEDLQQLISDLKTQIRDGIQRYMDYSDLYKEMITNNRLAEQTTRSQGEFLVLKEGHHAFEHFLRKVRYELVIERFHIIAELMEKEPRYSFSLDLIELLEEEIQEYLLSNAHIGCVLHSNSDAQERNLTIRVQSRELPNIENRSNQEEIF